MKPHKSIPANIDTTEAFYAELEALKARFMKMEPELEVTVRDPDQGVEGYVVVWNTGICKGGPFDKNGKGIGKGGTRVLPDLSLSDVKRLARAMAEKNAAAGLPLGGAKSGLRYDSKAPDYEQKFRRFAKLVQNSGILAEDGGIFGGFGYDVGCKPPLNAIWACEELGTKGSFTGKPINMGGTDYDREGIAGLGVAVAARTLMKVRGRNIAETSFAVQGVGAMGAAVIRYFKEFGGILKYVSDPRLGGLWELESADTQPLVDALFAQETDKAAALLQQRGRLVSPDASQVLVQPVDILFPCALEDVLTDKNAALVQAAFVCEGANNPTSDEAHRILFERGITVIPDIIANPGGIISAFVELSSDVPDDENLATRAKTVLARKMTEDRVERNVIELLGYVDNLAIQPDKAGDFMAYRNIFYGIPDEA